jgi:hypothetical protein
MLNKMTRKKANKIHKKEVPEENKNLPGFDIRINSFGEVQSTYEIDEVNAFLNKNLRDKKLKNKTKEGKDEKDKPDSVE